MDAQLKAKWVEALRSGDYQQGRAQLRNHDAFCCLGVLCDLVDSSRWVEVNRSHYRYRGLDYSALSFPPSDVSSRVGLRRKHLDAVVEMNDEGKSFAEIAAYIEANL